MSGSLAGGYDTLFLSVAAALLARCQIKYQIKYPSGRALISKTVFKEESIVRVDFLIG